MDISLVIPAYNEERWLGDTLKSVCENGKGKFKEVIVVDNASTDRTAEIAASYPGVRVVREDRKGTGYARERGFREATGDIVGFMDADTLMSSTWADKVRRAFIRDQNLACVSGPYYFYDMPAAFSMTYTALWHIAIPLFYVISTFITAGNFAIRRSTLEKMGGFDTSITFHGDDADVGRRAARYGKVRPLWGLVLKSSGRRFHAFGTSRMLYRYLVNSLVGTFTTKPHYTEGYQEVR